MFAPTAPSASTLDTNQVHYFFFTSSGTGTGPGTGTGTGTAPSSSTQDTRQLHFLNPDFFFTSSRIILKTLQVALG